jgi:hypothetical protein
MREQMQIFVAWLYSLVREELRQANQWPRLIRFYTAAWGNSRNVKDDLDSSTLLIGEQSERFLLIFWSSGLPITLNDVDRGAWSRSRDEPCRLELLGLVWSHALSATLEAQNNLTKKRC